MTPSVRVCPTVWDPVSRVVLTDGGRAAAWVDDSAAVSVDNSVVYRVEEERAPLRKDVTTRRSGSDAAVFENAPRATNG